jgi:hypothetical protein
MDFSRTQITRSSGNIETLPATALHFDAEPAHEIERDFDVRLRNQLALHNDPRIGSSERQSHEKRSQELGRHVSAHADRTFHVHVSLMNRQWGIAFGAQVIDARADVTQCGYEVLYRPLVHPRHSGQFVLSTCKSQHSGQGPESRPGIAEE